jgi:predicted DNA-binding transcriptional regulator AlpA
MRRNDAPKEITTEAALPVCAGRPLREREAAGRLGLTPNTLSKWRMHKTGPRFVRFNRTIRYYESDINAWLQEHVVEPDREGVA